MLSRLILSFSWSVYVIAVDLLSGTGAIASLFPRNEELRLIKTSLDDPGRWVTEEEKFALVANHTHVDHNSHFVDITDTLELEQFRAAMAKSPLTRRQSTFPTGPSHQNEANPLIATISSSNPLSWATEMTNMFTRYYRSSQYAAPAATWMFNTVKHVASANSAIIVSQFTHTFNQPSVIAKIPGTSANVVVVSAHFDSIGSTSTGQAPGADDNASGIVTILESLRVLAAAKYAPKNTLEFHFYAGEEGGHLGARAIMQDYVKRAVNVLALMNQDMTGYSLNRNIAVYTDYVSAPLTAFVVKLVPVYTGLPVVTDQCGYACSDHGAAHDAGYPAAYVCDEIMADSSPYIHSAMDTLSTVDFSHVNEHIKLTVGFLVEGSYF